MGVELTAEIVEAYAGKKVTLVASTSRLFEGKPAKLGTTAAKWFKEHKVEVSAAPGLLGQPRHSHVQSLRLCRGMCDPRTDSCSVSQRYRLPWLIRRIACSTTLLAISLAPHMHVPARLFALTSDCLQREGEQEG